MHVIDISIVVVYLLSCLIIGYYKTTDVKNITEYTLGNRNFQTVTLVATVFATYISARASVGDVALIYSSGMIYGTALILSFILWIIFSTVFAKNIDQFYGCISLSEIVDKLYGKSGLIVSNICIFFVSVGVIATQVIAIGYLFKHFLGLSYELGAVLGLGIVTLYSAFGGIRAVATTDLLQFLIFFIVFPVACGFLYQEIGGYQSILNTLPRSYFTLYTEDEGIWLSLSYIFYFLIPSIFPPYTQRLLMSKNVKQLVKTFYLVAFLTLIFSIIIVLIGLMIKVKNPILEPNQALYFFIDEYLPIGVKGFMVSAMMAIFMSTSDSWLNASSTIVAHDIIKKIYPRISNKQEVTIAKISTFFISIISVVIALKIQNITEILFLSLHFWYPIFTIPIITGFLRFRTNSDVFLIGAITGIIVCVGCRVILGKFGTISLAFGVIGNAVGFFSSHYYFNQDDRIKLLDSLMLKVKLICKSSKFVPQYLNNQIKLLDCNNLNIKFLPFFSGYFIIHSIPIFILFPISQNFLVNFYLIGSILCLITFFNRNTKNTYKVYYSYFTISYCLGFISCYGFFISNYKIMWGISIIISFYIMLQIFYNSTLTIFYGIISIISSYICTYIINIHHYDHAILAHYSCGASVILIILLLYIERREKNLKINVMKILAASIAHEIRTPLASLNFCLHEIEQRTKNTSIVSKAKQELFKCNEIVHSILQNLKLERDIKLEILSVNECIADALSEIKILVKENVLINNNVENNTLIMGDKLILKQIIINLIKNSLESISKAGHGEICIKSYQNREEIAIEIMDTGLGMLPELSDNIFTTELDNKFINSNGIGLIFCKYMLKKMQAYITCKSEYQKYTSFIMWFKQCNI